MIREEGKEEGWECKDKEARREEGKERKEDNEGRMIREEKEEG